MDLVLVFLHYPMNHNHRVGDQGRHLRKKQAGLGPMPGVRVLADGREIARAAQPGHVTGRLA